MICTKCRDVGQRSRVDVLGSITGTMTKKEVFFDEDGDMHVHDPNIVTTAYRCSNGHRFQERSSWQCTCGWMKQPAVVTFLGESGASA